MPFINGGHIWLILGLIVLLVIFGPGKLPELGTAVGKTIKAFKRSTEDLKAEMAHKDSEQAVAGVRAEAGQNEPIRAEKLPSEHVRAESARVEPMHTEPTRFEA